MPKKIVQAEPEFEDSQENSGVGSGVGVGAVGGGVGTGVAVQVTAGPGSDPNAWQSLYQVLAKKKPDGKPLEFRSILINEDLIVAAMAKSILRSGDNISIAAVYQALRDGIGQISELDKPQTVTPGLVALVAAAPGGSEDKIPMVPPPQPA